MTFRRTRVLLPALAAAALSAQAAGTVEVRFIDPQHYHDAGHTRADRERTQQALAEHLRQWAQRLPDGQTLAVDVLDIDLAGVLQPTRFGNEVRLLRGGADWPRITLRYTLGSGETLLRQGEESISDLAYQLGTPRPSEHGPLPYETRMLDRWFAERVLARQAQ